MLLHFWNNKRIIKNDIKVTESAFVYVNKLQIYNTKMKVKYNTNLVGRLLLLYRLSNLFFITTMGKY